MILIEDEYDEFIPIGKYFLILQGLGAPTRIKIHLTYEETLSSVENQLRMYGHHGNIMGCIPIYDSLVLPPDIENRLSEIEDAIVVLEEAPVNVATGTAIMNMNIRIDEKFAEIEKLIPEVNIHNY